MSLPDPDAPEPPAPGCPGCDAVIAVNEDALGAIVLDEMTAEFDDWTLTDREKGLIRLAARSAYIHVLRGVAVAAVVGGYVTDE